MGPRNKQGDTGRTADGKPKCRQGYAIFGSRVAPPGKEEGRLEGRRCFAGFEVAVATVGQMVSRRRTRSNTGRKKKRNNETRSALRRAAPLEIEGGEDAPKDAVARYIDETILMNEEGTALCN
jgi:hypothetical protein